MWSVNTNVLVLSPPPPPTHWKNGFSIFKRFFFLLGCHFPIFQSYFLYLPHVKSVNIPPPTPLRLLPILESITVQYSLKKMNIQVQAMDHILTDLSLYLTSAITPPPNPKKSLLKCSGLVVTWSGRRRPASSPRCSCWPHSSPRRGTNRTRPCPIKMDYVIHICTSQHAPTTHIDREVGGGGGGGFASDYNHFGYRYQWWTHRNPYQTKESKKKVESRCTSTYDKYGAFSQFPWSKPNRVPVGTACSYTVRYLLDIFVLDFRRYGTALTISKSRVITVFDLFSDFTKFSTALNKILYTAGTGTCTAFKALGLWARQQVFNFSITVLTVSCFQKCDIL